jgi:hypothetical protein
VEAENLSLKTEGRWRMEIQKYVAGDGIEKYMKGRTIKLREMY